MEQQPELPVSEMDAVIFNVYDIQNNVKAFQRAVVAVEGVETDEV